MAPFLSTFLVFTALLLRPVISQTTVDYCQLLADVLSICEVETPSFSLLPATEQAGCVCGSQLSTLSWGPASFDGLVSDCAVQYATIDVTIANDASSLEGFCTNFAGAAPTVSSAPTTTAASPQNTPSSAFPSNTIAGGVTTPTPTETIGSSPTTVTSVVTSLPATSTSTSTPNAAVRAQHQGSDVIEAGLAMGALLLGVYVMA